MEGEAQVSSPEPVSTPEPVQSEPIQTTESTPEPTNDKPAGFDPIDVKTATPEQIEARLNRLYGNMKRFEGGEKQQRELNEALVREITTIRQGQSELVSHLQNADYQDAEARLASQRTDAWNRGDFEGFNAANDKINDIKIKKNLAEATKTQPRQQPAQQGVNGNQVVERAASQGVMTPDEVNVTKAWMEETDQTGNFKRPWASDTSDPKNYAAALEAQAVFNSPLYANKPMAEKLREVDRRMGIQQQPVRSNVLPAGNLTNGVRTNTIKLDPAIEKIAIRTKFGGPKAKSDQDHIDAWKKAVAKSKGAN